MARVLFILSLLLVVFTTARVFGAPSQSHESPNLNRQKRTFGFSLLGDRDWEEFRWPFVTMTPIKSTMSMFQEENSKESLAKRLEALENGHKQIIEFLKKMQDTMSANQCRPSSAEKQRESVPLFTPQSSAVPKLDVRVQTDTPVQSTTQAPAKITAPEVKVKVEPSTASNISAAAVEDKTVPLTSTNTTSAEVGVKVQPSRTDITSAEIKVESSTTKISSTEVEVKREPITSMIKITSTEDNKESLTPAEITTAEVKGNTGPTTRPQEDPLSEESTEKVSTEKIETPQVDADAPATTTATETVVDSDQEATTQVEENNDINNILI